MHVASVPAVFLVLYLVLGVQPKAAVSAEPPFIENWMPIHQDVISGASPDSRSAFAELHRQGVRTIISVDGTPPNLKIASELGLRYVHVPIGYDGIDDATTKQLASAINQLPKPIFFHCHHGRHRGPAAAVVACIASGRINVDHGENWLRTAGTSTDYDGLYRSVRNTRPLDNASLAKPIKFAESVDPDDLVTTMLKLEEHFVELGLAIKNNDRSRQQHRATLIAESYREMARAKYNVDNAKLFARKISEAETTAEKLRQSIRQDVAVETISPIYRRIAEQCKLCHRRHRD